MMVGFIRDGVYALQPVGFEIEIPFRLKLYLNGATDVVRAHNLYLNLKRWILR